MSKGIKCCYKCIPPKRHIGCHASCEEYIEEKALHEKYKNTKKNKTLIDEYCRKRSLAFNKVLQKQI